MRVVVVAGYAPSLINFRGLLLKAMVEAGHSVIACAPGEHPLIAEKLRAIGVTYQSLRLDRTGVNLLMDVAGIWKLYRLFKQERPDVVLNYTIKPVIYGSLAASVAGVPKLYSIITGLGYAFTRGSVLTRVVRRLYKIALARNEAVFFQNRDDLEEFQRGGILRSDLGRPCPVVLNGSGVDLEYFAECRESKGQDREPEEPLSTFDSRPSTKSNSGAPTFLLIARLLRDKGILEFVEAARALKAKCAGAKFQLLGPFDSNPAALRRDELDAWIKEGTIEYLGELDDVRPALRACDVYVLPSYREGTPRTVLEAMAMSKPIITADAPGCRETIRRNAEMLRSGNSEIVTGEGPAGIIRGENGFLVPIRDGKSLAGAMEEFITHPELICEMGRRSREYAEERYDVHKVNAVILKEMGLVGEVTSDQ